MQLQGRNLTQRLKGDDVALLHEELGRLGVVIDRAEVADKRFGASTHEAVLAFQRRHRLEATGVVDEITARQINAEVDRLEPRPESVALMVRGALRNPDGSPVPRALVKAVDIGLRAETPLGDVPTGADGKYKIRYRQEQLRPEGKLAADLIVRAYGEDGNELARSERLCHAPTEAVVDLVVGNVPLRGPSEYDTLVARVRPYLGETALADLGKEDVRFLVCSAEVDRRQVATLIVANRLARDTSLPDWLFYAFGRQGMTLLLPALLGHSLRHLRESIERAIESHIVAPLADAAELDRWMDRLRSVLRRTAFETSVEPGRLSMGELLGTSFVSREVQEDFLSRYLAREGSLDEFWRSLEEDESFDATAREDLRFTLHLGMLTQYHAPLMGQLKALRQHGELKSLRDLAGFDRTRWRQLLEASASGDIILPSDIPGRTPEERLNHYITTLREPIEALFPSDSLRHALTRASDTAPAVQTFLTNTPKLDLYWTNIDDFLANAGDGAFTGIADDQRGHVVDDVRAVQRLVRIAPRADQVRVLRKAGFDSAYKIARASRRHFKTLFVETAEAMKDSLDGAYMVLSPATGDMPGTDTQMMLLSGQAPETMADMVYNQASGKAAASLTYVLAAKDLMQYEGPLAVTGSKEAQDQAKKELLKKNPDLEALFSSLSYCECQHCRSVYSPTAYLVDLLHWLEADNENLKAEPHSAKGPIHALLKRRPDLADLALTCENTNTTLPYSDLVNEVLESFIFTHLKLIPNIDPNQPVGIEWSDSPVGGKTLEPRDTGAAKAEDLRAVPQYIIPEVYEHLATKAVYPMTLPFHRPLEVVRAYLSHLGTSRAEIMEVFRTGTPPVPSDEDLSRERLGLSPALADIITASGNQGTIGNMGVWQYYGLANEDELQSKLTKIPDFLSLTGLSMEELVELLKTRFINPHIYDDPTQSTANVITIAVDPKDPCDVSKMTLKNLTWTDNEFLDKYQWLTRIHRFLRLWRAVAWPMADVDRAIHTFGGKLDTAALPKVEALRWLKDELKQPVENLLAFWGKLDTWGPNSLYDRLFLGKGLVPTDPAAATSSSLFTLAADRTELSNTSLLLEDHLPAVFAALQLTAADYEAIKGVETFDPHSPTQPPPTPQQPTMTLRNLSLLYRYGVLARSLKLRVKDVATLVRLIPGDHHPFSPNEPEAARRFVRLVRTIQESNFSVPLLNYLFRHEEEPTRHPAPARVLIVNTLKTIAEGLAQVNRETESSEDPLGEALRNQLGLLQPLLTQPKQGEEIQQTVDMIDWRREDFQASAGETFIEKLHDTLVKDLGSSFLGPNLTKDKSTLFGNLQQNETKDQRFAKNIVYLRDKLLPWLRERLQRSLVFQTLAAALGLDEAVTKTLVERILHSTATPPAPGQPKPALAVFLDLATLDEFLKLVEEKGGPQAFDFQTFKAPPVLTFVRVFKAAQVIKAFEMAEPDLAYLSKNSAYFKNFNLNDLPLELKQSDTPKQLFLWWIELERFFSLRNSLPKSERTLVDYLNDLKVVPTLPEDKTLATLVEATGWEEQQITTLEAAGFKRDTVEALQILQRAVRLLKRVGASATQLSTWAKAEPNYKQASAVIEAVKARYDRAQWLEVARGLNDPMREKQRAALVDFLVARMTRPHAILKMGSPLKDAVKELQGKLNVALAPFQVLMPGVLPLEVDGNFDPNTQMAVKTFQQVNKLTVDGIVGPITWAALDRAVGDVFDKNRLLEHFLIDIEMSSCMLTSRIKQAISSVQMFVQRCLLNLEPEVSPADIDADQWKWMKNYRVWEANRKVFLYPENWIEPELRDDKTPFFKDLETELLQNELTDETVEKSLVNYLYKLDEVARLDIRGFCKEEKEENNETKEIYHVFGRTWNPPYVYHYRRGIFTKGGHVADEWTPWERVDLDIQGDHLVPVVWNRRLYLFWLVSKEKQGGPQPESDTPQMHWEFRLAWAEYHGEQWSGKKGSTDATEEDKCVWIGANGSYQKIDLPTNAVLTETYKDSFEKVVTGPGRVWLTSHIGTDNLQIDVLYVTGGKVQAVIRYLGTYELACGKGMLVTKKTESALANLPLGLEKYLQIGVNGQLGFGRVESSASSLMLPFFSSDQVLHPQQGWYLVLSKLELSPLFFLQDGPKGNQTYFTRPVVVTQQPQLELPVGSTVIDLIEKPAEVAPTYWFDNLPDPVYGLTLIEPALSQPSTNL